MSNKEGYWISAEGKMFYVPFQRHAETLAEIFNEVFDSDKVLTYYHRAFEKGFVRISIYKDQLSIQLEKPASKEQKDICAELFESFEKVCVTYERTEGQISTERQLLLSLEGKNPFLSY